VQRERAARVEQAQKALDDDIGMLVVSKYMGKKMTSDVLRMVENHAERVLLERGMAGVSVEAIGRGGMLGLKAHALDRR
jgi:hypothetical protein